MFIEQLVYLDAGYDVDGRELYVDGGQVDANGVVVQAHRRRTRLYDTHNLLICKDLISIADFASESFIEYKMFANFSFVLIT